MIVSETKFVAKPVEQLREQFPKAVNTLFVLDTMDTITRDLNLPENKKGFPNNVPDDCVFDYFLGVRLIIIPVIIKDAEYPLLTVVMHIMPDGPFKTIQSYCKRDKSMLHEIMINMILEVSVAPYVIPLEDVRIIQVDDSLFYFHMLLPSSWPVSKRVTEFLLNE